MMAIVGMGSLFLGMILLVFGSMYPVLLTLAVILFICAIVCECHISYYEEDERNGEV